MMKQQTILFILKNKNEASSRFRVLSYLPYLENDFNYSLFYAEYNNKKVPKILRSVIKRFRFLNLLFQAKKHDIIFMQRPMSSDKSKSTFFESLLKKVNPNIIFDFDDALFVQNEQKIKSLISLSKACICGNDYLASFAKKYNPHTHIIPTPIDTNKFKPASSKTSKKLSIGWTGTSGNYDFFTKELINALKITLQKYQDTIDFVFICDRKPPERFDFDYTFIQWRDESEVMDLQNIDIGLMPLIDSAWTKGKCGFKLIQYGSIGIASLASDVGVNKDVVLDSQTGYIIDNEQQWLEKLEALITNPSLREEMGRKASEHIQKHYSVKENYPKLKTLLQHL